MPVNKIQTRLRINTKPNTNTSPMKVEQTGTKASVQHSSTDVSDSRSRLHCQGIGGSIVCVNIGSNASCKSPPGLIYLTTLSHNVCGASRATQEYSTQLTAAFMGVRRRHGHAGTESDQHRRVTRLNRRLNGLGETS